MSREISLVIDYDGITKTELRVKVQRLAPQMHPYPRFAGLPPKGEASHSPAAHPTANLRQVRPRSRLRLTAASPRMDS
jgi:hypothetical protein